MIQQSTPGHVSRQNYNSERHMQPHSQSSTIHNNQDMETTYMSIERWTDKEAVVCIHNGVLIQPQNRMK